MNKTDWIVYGIVILAVFYTVTSVIFRKKKGCCAKGCSAVEKPPEEKPDDSSEKDGHSCHKK